MAGLCELCGCSPCVCCSIAGCSAPAPPTKVDGKGEGKYHHMACCGLDWSRATAKIARAFGAASKDVKAERSAAGVKLGNTKEENLRAVLAKADVSLKADFPNGPGARAAATLALV